MALQFWFGASGSGKSTLLQKYITEQSKQHPKQEYFIIVPDQFTMQTQRQMVKMNPDGGILNIDVLSFGRLAHRIFGEVGRDNRIVLDDTGKCLLLRKVAEQQKENIPVLAARLRHPGYVQEVKSVLSEFMQYGLRPEDVKELAVFAHSKRPLSLKLEDLSVIYAAFLKECEERFLTKEEMLDLLRERLPLSDVIRRSVIVFDGFTGFTPIQNKVIAQLMSLAKDVIVTLEMDHRYSPYRVEGEEFLFHLTRQTVFSLQKCAMERNVSLKEDVILDETPVKRFIKNPQMSHLERNLFREDAQIYEGDNTSMKVMNASNIRRECQLMCEEMFNYIREQGYRYRDVAVVCGDMNRYEAPLRQQFEKYKIPYFMDTTRSMLTNPFVAFIRNGIAVLRHGFRYPDVFRFLRTGMMDFTLEEIDRLENYVRARGIKGYRAWSNPFAYPHKESAKDVSEFECLNEIRQRVAEVFGDLYQKSTEGVLPAKSWCEMLYEFCVAQDMQKKLDRFADEFEAKGQLSEAVEYRQVYRLIMELFDQIAGLLGEDKLTLQEFSDILDAGFAEIRVRSLPMEVDLLVVGDIQRTRLKEIKALFFLGVNDGNIPQSTGNGGLISDMEREFLLESGRELAPTPASLMFMEHLYLYMNLTKPEDKLYLSYSSMEDDGTAMRPAYLIAELKKMFPQLQVCYDNGMSQILSLQDAKEEIACMLNEYVSGNMNADRQKLFYALYADMAGREECKEWLQDMTDAAFLVYKPNALSKSIAEKLYGKIMECSISSLEKFAACHYAHFLSYGLRLAEREEYGFANFDMGNVMHDILQSFGKMLDREGIEWSGISEEETERFVEAAVEEISAVYDGAILKEGAKNQYFITQLKRIVKRSIKTLQVQLKHGTFRPYAFEKEFHNIYNIPGEGHTNSQVLLKGRIDRIDTCVQGDEMFVKVIDYKSGNRSFDINTLYYGVALQLTVYLGQAMKSLEAAYPDKKILPGAMFYYRTVDPLLSAEKVFVREEAELEILKELTPKGAVSARAGVVEALDEGLQGKSVVAPVTTKDGAPKLSNSVFDPVMLNNMLDFAQQKTFELADWIMDGKIDINPMEISKTDACEYCEYKGACGFDGKIRGYEKRNPEEIDQEVFRPVQNDTTQDAEESSVEDGKKEEDKWQ